MTLSRKSRCECASPDFLTFSFALNIKLHLIIIATCKSQIRRTPNALCIWCDGNHISESTKHKNLKFVFWYIMVHKAQNVQAEKKSATFPLFRIYKGERIHFFKKNSSTFPKYKRSLKKFTKISNNFTTSSYLVVRSS